MPRKRKAARKFSSPSILTDAQEDILRFGMVILDRFPRGGFKSDGEMRAAWKKHREKIMRSWDSPGCRPYAYLRFDLGIQEPSLNWIDELQLLQQHKLLTREEEAQIENQRTELSPTQYANFNDPRYCAMNIEQSIRALPEDEQAWILARHIKREQFISDWHMDRGRAELAEKYQRRADILKGMASGDRQVLNRLEKAVGSK